MNYFYFFLNFLLQQQYPNSASSSSSPSSSSSSIEPTGWLDTSYKVEKSLVILLSFVNVSLSFWFSIRLCRQVAGRNRLRHIIYFHLISIIFFSLTIIKNFMEIFDFASINIGTLVLFFLLSAVHNGLYVSLISRPMYSWPRIFFSHNFCSKWRTFIIVFEIIFTSAFCLLYSPIVFFDIKPQQKWRKAVASICFIIFVIIHLSIAAVYLSFNIFLQRQRALVRIRNRSLGESFLPVSDLSPSSSPSDLSFPLPPTSSASNHHHHHHHNTRNGGVNDIIHSDEVEPMSTRYSKEIGDIVDDEQNNGGLVMETDTHEHISSGGTYVSSGRIGTITLLSILIMIASLAAAVHGVIALVVILSPDVDEELQLGVDLVSAALSDIIILLVIFIVSLQLSASRVKRRASHDIKLDMTL